MRRINKMFKFDYEKHEIVHEERFGCVRTGIMLKVKELQQNVKFMSILRRGKYNNIKFTDDKIICFPYDKVWYNTLISNITYLESLEIMDNKKFNYEICSKWIEDFLEENLIDTEEVFIQHNIITVYEVNLCRKIEMILNLRNVVFDVKIALNDSKIFITLFTQTEDIKNMCMDKHYIIKNKSNFNIFSSYVNKAKTPCIKHILSLIENNYQFNKQETIFINALKLQFNEVYGKYTITQSTNNAMILLKIDEDYSEHLLLKDLDFYFESLNDIEYLIRTFNKYNIKYHLDFIGESKNGFMKIDVFEYIYKIKEFIEGVCDGRE